MNLTIEPGKYVLAISGGVDSMAMLDILARQYAVKNQSGSLEHDTSASGRQFVIGHFDHGIRTDSAEDRKLVQHTAKELGLSFAFAEGKLGAGTSEAKARQARYEFLRSLQSASGARAIVTAHHQDDRLETAIINLLRGTGRGGLSPMKNQGDVIRPLLQVTKRQLRAYATSHHLDWREDSTNSDTSYLRNNVRLSLLPKFSIKQRQQLLAILDKAATTNYHLDTQLVNYLHAQPSPDHIKRHDFIILPHFVAREVMASWLRQHNIRDFDRKTLERLVVAAKTGQTGTKIDIIKGHQLRINKITLALQLAER